MELLLTNEIEQPTGQGQKEYLEIRWQSNCKNSDNNKLEEKLSPRFFIFFEFLFGVCSNKPDPSITGGSGLIIGTRVQAGKFLITHFVSLTKENDHEVH